MKPGDLGGTAWSRLAGEEKFWSMLSQADFIKDSTQQQSFRALHMCLKESFRIAARFMLQPLSLPSSHPMAEAELALGNVQQCLEPQAMHTLTLSALRQASSPFPLPWLSPLIFRTRKHIVRSTPIGSWIKREGLTML